LKNDLLESNAIDVEERSFALLVVVMALYAVSSNLDWGILGYLQMVEGVRQVDRLEQGVQRTFVEDYRL
jgi:hypothetical protein